MLRPAEWPLRTPTSIPECCTQALHQRPPIPRVASHRADAAGASRPAASLCRCPKAARTPRRTREDELRRPCAVPAQGRTPDRCGEHGCPPSGSKPSSMPPCRAGLSSPGRVSASRNTGTASTGKCHASATLHAAYCVHDLRRHPPPHEAASRPSAAHETPQAHHRPRMRGHATPARPRAGKSVRCTP